MAPGRPAGAVAEKTGVINVADKNGSRRGLCLGMAFEAEIRVALHEHLGVDGTVRAVTNGAAFAHCSVFENKRPRLLAMALGAIFIEARHGEPAGWFHNVHAVGIVALDAVHFAFDDWMMLREMKFRAGFLMALEARLGVFAGINDKFFQSTASGHGDVFAAGTVAGFAAELPRHIRIRESQTRMRA
jgi:hypothetical protein